MAKKKRRIFDDSDSNSDSDSDDYENERQVIGGVIKGKHGSKRGKVIHPQKVPRNQQQHQRRRQPPSSRVSVQCLYHIFLLIFRATSINL